MRQDDWIESDFAAVFDAVYPGLGRYLECMLGRSGAAQDVAQEAFLRLYRLGPNKIARGEERFWLYRVATNLALNDLRRARSRERLASAIPHVLRPRADDPYAAAERADARDRLLVALAGLGEHQRAAFLLREQQGLSYDGIARALGVSLAKVKVDIHRARRALRAELETVSAPRRKAER